MRWVVAGAAIGIVSSLLGVAGGELIIPTLVFVFGLDIKLAGTLSLMSSLPTILMGLWRQSAGQPATGRPELIGLALPMAAGSVCGAIVGAVLASQVSGPAIKLLLGGALIASAFRLFAIPRDAAVLGDK